MPTAVTSHAMRIAPTPADAAMFCGREKIPPPIIDPTTSAVSAPSLSFWFSWLMLPSPRRAEWREAPPPSGKAVCPDCSWRPSPCVRRLLGRSKLPLTACRVVSETSAFGGNRWARLCAPAGKHPQPVFSSFASRSGDTLLIGSPLGHPPDRETTGPPVDLERVRTRRRARASPRRALRHAPALPAVPRTARRTSSRPASPWAVAAGARVRLLQPRARLRAKPRTKELDATAPARDLRDGHEGFPR